MLLQKILVFVSLIVFFGCSSQSTKPLSQETQAKVDKAEVRTKLELVIELGAVIEESNLNSKDKDYLMNRYENFVKDMVINLAEQNKITSALINNLSSTDHEGMETKNDLRRRFGDIEKENSKKRLAMIAEITDNLQGKITADKIEKINQLLAQRGFLIIEASQ